MQHVIPALPAEHLASILEVEEHYWWHAERRRWVTTLMERFLQGKPDHLVDVGCGTGGTAHFWRSEFPESKITLVDAVDCRASENSSFAFIEKDASEFELSEPADVITCLDVIEHIPHPVSAFEGLHRNLREGGIAIVTVPGHKFLFSQWDTQLGHLKRYTRKELRAELEAAGFQVEFISHLFSFALPYLYFRKFSKGSTTFPKLAFPLPWLLALVSAVERRWVQWWPSSLGTSIIAIARR